MGRRAVAAAIALLAISLRGAVGQCAGSFPDSLLCSLQAIPCGVVGDGCGGSLDCGGCAGGLHCLANRCVVVVRPGLRT